MLKRVLACERRAAAARGLTTRLPALRRSGGVRRPRNTAAGGKHDDADEARGFLLYLRRSTRQKSFWSSDRRCDKTMRAA